MTRTDVEFNVGDDFCAAWLYRPESSPQSTTPIIVMAHGLGSVKEKRLDAFAERFTAHGYACLVFDYRHFGASGGEPRQLLDIDRQLEDWKSAVAYARSLDGIDADRVVVWGTSFGGGHAIITAAQDSRITAAIVQCPFTDGLASSRTTPRLTSAKVAALALRDTIGARLGREPVMVPTYGPPGSTALMTAPDCEPGVLSLIPEGMKVRGEVAARFALHVTWHRPGRYAEKVACPILFVISENDTVAPAAATKKFAAKAPRGEITLHEAGHFDIYVGEWFERNVNDQLGFLSRHVPTA